MIKKSRARFILATMTIVFVIFAVLFIGFFNTNKKTFTENIDDLLDNDIKFIMSHSNDLIIYINCDAIYINDIFYTKDANTITEEICQPLYEKAKEKNNPDSLYRSGSYFYKYYKNQMVSIFVVKDMKVSLSNFNSINVKTFSSLLALYCCIFVITYILSFKVFSPIEKMITQQKCFISDASHELKTPLTIINANAEVLANENDSQWIQNIKAQTKRLDSLVADMLSLSKFDEKKVELLNEDFDITSLAYETLLPFDAVAFENEKKINLNIQQGLKVKGDQNSAKKIMTILIDNAIKYSLKYSDIEVNLYKEKKNINHKEKNIVKFSVKNAGSSVKDEDSQKVFERFYRGNSSRNQEVGGSGLGLSIAKSIADANGWKIFAISHYGTSMEIILTIKTK